MSNIEISVYIPCHNYGNFLESAIESVLRQTFDSWELLIIDDNSSDNSQEIMSLYQGDDRIRLFKLEGVGLPAVCNFAIKNSNGKNIIRLDADDIFDENALIVLHNWLVRRPDYALVFSDYYFIDNNGEIYSHERREKIYEHDNLLDMPANGACSLLRKNVYEEIGGYREDLGAQDGFDLWNKLVLGRYKVGNVNIPLFYYRRHDSNLTNSNQRILAARRRIKSDSVFELAKGFKPIIAIIPSREKYDFVPNTWSLDLHGKSLLEKDIEKCIKSKLFDYIVVTSDNDGVEAIVNKYSDNRISFFKRDPKNTIRSAPLVNTIEEIVSFYNLPESGILVLSYHQAPFVTTNTLEEAVTTLILNNADSSIGVEKMNQQVYKRGNNGLTPLNIFNGLNSNFDSIYREANIALALKISNIKNGSLRGSKIVHFEVDANECYFIDSIQKHRIAKIIADDS
jgi:glycosyltransferase involved in cell wall biosynthesis